MCHHPSTFYLRLRHHGKSYEYIQVVALVSYILAYFPGGTQTLRFGSQMALRGAGSLLPL